MWPVVTHRSGSPEGIPFEGSVSPRTKVNITPAIWSGISVQQGLPFQGFHLSATAEGVTLISSVRKREQIFAVTWSGFFSFFFSFCFVSDPAILISCRWERRVGCTQPVMSPRGYPWICTTRWPTCPTGPDWCVC